MRLVKQEQLEYREGSSDKVYEVDLVEVSSGRYVVNFRYGRRGTTLKEGTKTGTAVDLARAEAVFAELVGSKVKKGYQRAGAAPQAVPKPARQTAPRPSDAAERERVLLERLARGPRDGGWPVERAIWRAGELGLGAAVPSLVRMIGTGPPVRDYAIAWALGRCGEAAAVEPLSRLFAEPKSPDHVRRIAREALLSLSSDALRAQFRADTAATLPDPLRDAHASGDAARFAAALDDYLASPVVDRPATLETLYLIDDEVVRPALIAALARVPLRAPWFRAIRHVFKAAEYRFDAEVFGLIAYRFEKEPSTFRNQWEWGWYHGRLDDGSFFQARIRDEIAKDDSRIAYGHETRTYLRRRVWRTLRRLGELGDPRFVRMAVGVLLPFTDADAAAPRRSTMRRWQDRSWVTTTRDYGQFAPYLALNGLLYSNGRRFELSRTGMCWWYRKGAEHEEPTGREEAFPELWDATPAGLLHLVSASACGEVHRFATTALRTMPAFLERLDDPAVIMLVGRDYDVTVRMGVDLARPRYASARSVRLAVAVANCRIGEARAEAHRWIEADAGRFLADEASVAALALSPHADTRRAAAALLARPGLAPATGAGIAARVLGALATCEDPVLAGDIRAMLDGPLGAYLEGLDVELFAPLFAHPLAEVRDAAVAAFARVNAPVESILTRFVPALLASDDPGVRVGAVGLVAGMRDEDLLANPDAVAALVFDPHADVREAVRPLVARLSTPWTAEDVALAREGIAPETPAALRDAKAAFAASLARRAVDALLLAEPFEGLHDSLAHTLRDDIPGGVAAVTRDEAWRAIRAGSQAAKSIGGFALEASPDWGTDLDTDALVDLAFHEVRSIRSAAAAIYVRVLHRFLPTTGSGSHAEVARLARVLDSRWEDARAVWPGMFRVMQREQFTPAILVAICDSPHEDVRALGRELVRTHARPEDGLDYLVRFAEHPAADMQLFVTNYLDAYGRDDADRLRELAPYFAAVLARVNAGRAARDRVLELLAGEAEKSEAAARVAADVLSRFAATVAVEDRATAIASLVAIHRRYPEIPVPIAVVPVEVRHAV